MDNWPREYYCCILDQVDSTLDEAHRVAADISGPRWILAHKQTKGRGRRGRAWVDPEGNFASALIFRPQIPLDQIALFSFVASLALYDAFAALSVPQKQLSLKWPNDLLLDGGKLAGILLESITVGRQSPHLTIGIGANLIKTPQVDALDPSALPPVSLRDQTGLEVSSLALLGELAQSFAHYERLFVSSGFAPIREIWLSRAARLGTEITARTIKQELRGVFETIDAQGNLILVTDQGPKSIAAADVFF